MCLCSYSFSSISHWCPVRRNEYDGGSHSPGHIYSDSPARSWEKDGVNTFLHHTIHETLALHTNGRNLLCGPPGKVGCWCLSLAPIPCISNTILTKTGILLTGIYREETVVKTAFKWWWKEGMKRDGSEGEISRSWWGLDGSGQLVQDSLPYVCECHCQDVSTCVICYVSACKFSATRVWLTSTASGQPLHQDLYI